MSGGYPGKNIFETIEIDLFQAYDQYRKESCKDHRGRQDFECRQCTDRELAEKFAEGIAHAFGVIKGTDADTEWAEIDKKWTEAKAKSAASSGTSQN